MRVDEVSGASVTVSWEPPERDGGANVSGYVVEQREAHRPGWTTVSESVTRPCFKFTRLAEGTEYVFRVAAMNRFGVGGFLQTQVVECKSPESESRPHMLLTPSEVHARFEGRVNVSLLLTWPFIPVQPSRGLRASPRFWT